MAELNADYTEELRITLGGLLLDNVQLRKIREVQAARIAELEAQLMAKQGTA